MKGATLETSSGVPFNGFKCVHLSPGNDVSKTRWRPTVVSSRQATLVAPSARAQLAHRMHRGALSALEVFPGLKRATNFLARRPGTERLLEALPNH